MATELFVTRGHDGFSFGDIARIVGVTRANIHHHFGGKPKLVGEIVNDIRQDAELRIRRHWVDGAYAFQERLDLQLEDLRAFHQHYNPEPGDRRMWSPVSRLRHDLGILGEDARKALESVNRTYEQALQEALGKAVEAGEFRDDMPVADVARFLRVSFLAWPPATQDFGSFTDIEALFSIVARTIRAAWGKSADDVLVDSRE